MIRVSFTVILFVILTQWCELKTNSVSAQRILNLDATTFRDRIQHDTLILVSFHAPWCGHCTSLIPELKSAAKALHEKKLNVGHLLLDVYAFQIWFWDLFTARLALRLCLFRDLSRCFHVLTASNEVPLDAIYRTIEVEIMLLNNREKVVWFPSW